MDNHSDINLSQLRNYIIRYGAKCMENHESDLFYDCRALEKLCPGDSVYWMVSELHSYLYSSDEIIEKGLNVETLWGEPVQLQDYLHEDRALRRAEGVQHALRHGARMVRRQHPPRGGSAALNGCGVNERLRVHESTNQNNSI